MRPTTGHYVVTKRALTGHYVAAKRPVDRPVCGLPHHFSDIAGRADGVCEKCRSLRGKAKSRLKHEGRSWWETAVAGPLLCPVAPQRIASVGGSAQPVPVGHKLAHGWHVYTEGTRGWDGYAQQQISKKVEKSDALTHLTLFFKPYIYNYISQHI